MTAIPYEDWRTHPWLSKLDGASDSELDPAWFYTFGSAPAPLAALDQIVVQESGNGGPWQDSIRADRTFFPSRDWAQAAVGWYQRIWGFMEKDVIWSYRALVPARWDCTSVPRESQHPTCHYFTDWRTRTWACLCGWSGSNEQGLVYSNDEVVSIACPDCAHGLALIDRQPKADEVADAAKAGNPEALTIQDPETYANDYVRDPKVRRFLNGHETEVLFEHRDQFFGVPKDWLLPRLRLNQRAGQVDLFELGRLVIALDNRLIDDVDIDSVLGGTRRELCSYGDGGIVGGRTDIVGQWLVDWAPEVRHRLTWMDSVEEAGRELALAKIAEGMDNWWPQEGDRFEVTSPYLSTSERDDVEAILAMAGDADEVTLNEVVIRP